MVIAHWALGTLLLYANHAPAHIFAASYAASYAPIMRQLYANYTWPCGGSRALQDGPKTTRRPAARAVA